jgi:hypothetical protein
MILSTSGEAFVSVVASSFLPGTGAWKILMLVCLRTWPDDILGTPERRENVACSMH